MAEFVETKEAAERVILLAVSTGEEARAVASLNELADLVDTAGAVTVDKMIQGREQIHPATYIGRGKIDEVKERIWELDATGVVCDDELSPEQMKNLEDALDTKIMDRTMVILDIFARHAVTSEGKIQVELAQLRYSVSRLVGLRSSLSRLGGGIGTRGPGEKKIEIDRRVIRHRISQLNRELKEVQSHRDLLRRRREKSHIPVAAIVGYTNAGKSTLLNALTGAEILAEDKLFATLDPTTRMMEMESGQRVLFTDTVGFIHKLPHHLIEAFKSTLEEARYSDILLHVVDCSNPQMEMQMQVVYQTLRDLEIGEKTMITVFNKIDRRTDREPLIDIHSDYQIAVSAATGEHLEDLKALVEEILRSRTVLLERVFPYKQAGRIQEIRRFGQLVSEEYGEEGIQVKAYVPVQLYTKLILGESEI